MIIYITRSIKSQMESAAYRHTPTDVSVIVCGKATERRQPVHLIFVIDISDSMNENDKLSSVKRSIEYIIPLLTQDDKVSVITFGGDSQILLNKAEPSDLYIISGLVTNGSTNMSAALMNIKECVGSELKECALILTDGHANKGVTTTEGIQEIIHSLIKDSLTIATIAYGNSHNTELLKNIAVSGSGSYNIVYNLENVATVFGELLGGLTTLVAQNVTVHLPVGSVVKSGYATTLTATEVLVRIGDVYAENEIIVLAEVSPLAATARVTGYTMEDLHAYDQTTPFTQAPITKNIELAHYRYKVSRILVAKPYVKEKIQFLLEELYVSPYREESIVKIMIDDLEKLLERRNENLAQHSAYLSLGRGLRSIQPDDPRNTDVFDNTASPFSNTMQRRTVNSMHNATQYISDDEI